MTSKKIGVSEEVFFEMITTQTVDLPPHYTVEGF